MQNWLSKNDHEGFPLDCDNMFLMMLLLSISLRIPSIQIAKGQEASTRDYGPITPWVVPFQGTTVEHLGAVATNGHIHVFRFVPGPGGHDWDNEDVMASPNVGGQTVDGNSKITRWVTTGPKEHVAGVFTNGHLIEFWWTPNSGGWHVNDATATPQAGGQTLVLGGITSWLTERTEHVAGVSEDGHLHQFFELLGSDTWEGQTDITAEAPRQPEAGGQITTLAVHSISAAGFIKPNAGGVVSWVTGGSLEHVAGVSEDGHVRVFSRLPDQTGWHVVDATAQAGGSPTLTLGGITSWVMRMVHNA